MADIHSVIGTKNKKGQTFTDTWKMMNDAPRTPSFFTGSEVIKEALRRASCDVMIAYPITPQSEAAAYAPVGIDWDAGRAQLIYVSVDCPP